MTVSFDIDAHEYNGRWYNSIRAWKVLHGTGAPAPAAHADAPIPPAAEADPLAGNAEAEGGTNDDLPF